MRGLRPPPPAMGLKGVLSRLIPVGTVSTQECMRQFFSTEATTESLTSAAY